MGNGPTRPGDATNRPARFSLAGRITGAYLVLLAAMAGLAAATRTLPVSSWTVFLGLLLVGIPVGAWSIHRFLAPLGQIVSGVADGIRSYQDRDYTVRLAYRRNDELGELVELYNELGVVLQDERRAVTQRELLLSTALDRSPAAIVLINSIGRVAYSNREARRLLTGGKKLEGSDFETVRRGCPEEMQGILESERDGLFSVSTEDDQETYFLSQRTFQLNRRPHTLVLLRQITGDLERQEAAIWKKVIRILSHELNNSLAPISSLIHSAHLVAREPDHADRTEEIFTALRERLEYLQRFMAGYAQFARLPTPRREEVDWEEFLRNIAEYSSVRQIGRLPDRPGYFDPAQLQQVLINLIKNAEEASTPGAEIGLRVKESADGGTFLQVIDRGTGMSPEILEKALLPFYSTKQTGSGLGLPLCREILEAHGGKLSLQETDGGGTTVTCWLPPRRSQ